jgi:hypothetical protein
MRRFIQMWFDRRRARRHIKFMGYDRPLAERAAEAHRLFAQGGEIHPRRPAVGETPMVPITKGQGSAST